jgi:hypothetical protein
MSEQATTEAYPVILTGVYEDDYGPRARKVMTRLFGGLTNHGSNVGHAASLTSPDGLGGTFLENVLCGIRDEGKARGFELGLESKVATDIQAIELPAFSDHPFKLEPFAVAAVVALEGNVWFWEDPNDQHPLKEGSVAFIKGGELQYQIGAMASDHVTATVLFVAPRTLESQAA